MRPRAGALIKRPGWLIPVFFLSQFQLVAQELSFRDTETWALGGCYSCSPGMVPAMRNPATLPDMEYRSVFLNHGRLAACRELGITTIGLQLPAGQAGLGLCFSHLGIPGMQSNELKISCGLPLGKLLSAGLGIQFINTGISGEAFFSQGAGCSLGLRLKLTDHLELGSHFVLPRLWIKRSSELPSPLILTSGLCYSFFSTARLFLEVRSASLKAMQVGAGLEIELKNKVLLLLGIHHQPFGLAMGVRFRLVGFGIVLSSLYRPDTGIHPSSLLAYEWQTH